MRVKISYSVDFDEVPKIVNDKLIVIGNTLDSCGKAVVTNLWDASYLEKLESIDKVRKQMAVLDAQLEDCYSILAGYNKALADMKMPSEVQEETTNDRGN